MAILSVLSVPNVGYSRNASCALKLISTFLLHKLHKINNNYFVCFFFSEWKQRSTDTLFVYDTHGCSKNVQRIYQLRNPTFIIFITIFIKFVLMLFIQMKHIFMSWMFFFFDNLCLIFYTFIKINYYKIYLLIVVCWAVFLLYSLKNVTNKITVSNVADELDYGCSWIPTCKMRAIWLGSRKCCLVAGYKRPLIVNWCLIRTAIWWFLRTRCVTWTLSNHYTLIFVI